MRRWRLAGLAVALVAALAGGGWWWLRGSSLVAVTRVSVSGVSGADAPQIRAALTGAARRMTTLDLAVGELRRAVATFPEVGRLRVSAHGAHGVRIRVLERRPAAALLVGGQRLPVAADGVVLAGGRAGARLPLLVGLGAPTPGTVPRANARARAALAAVTSAPAPLRGHIVAVRASPRAGLTVALRDGPRLLFGDAGAIAAKWAAAARVLAVPAAAGAGAIYVKVPAHPAVAPGSVAGGR